MVSTGDDEPRDAATGPITAPQLAPCTEGDAGGTQSATPNHEAVPASTPTAESRTTPTRSGALVPRRHRAAKALASDVVAPLTRVAAATVAAGAAVMIAASLGPQTPDADGTQPAAIEPVLSLPQPSIPPAAAGEEPAIVRRVSVAASTAAGADARDFGATVFEVLNDRRGWARATGSVFAPQWDLDARSGRPGIATVALVDTTTWRAVCPDAPMVAGVCHRGANVYIDAGAWESTGDAFGDDRTAWRAYLINHGFGRATGFAERECPGEGALASVLINQTDNLNGCLANPWPVPPKP